MGSAAGQQLRLVALDPDHADTLLGLNQSAMRLAIAAGSVVGGGVIGAAGAGFLPWIGVAVVAVSMILLLSVEKSPKLRHAGA